MTHGHHSIFCSFSKVTSSCPSKMVQVLFEGLMDLCKEPYSNISLPLKSGREQRTKRTSMQTEDALIFSESRRISTTMSLARGAGEGSLMDSSISSSVCFHTYGRSGVKLKNMRFTEKTLPGCAIGTFGLILDMKRDFSGKNDDDQIHAEAKKAA